MITFTTAELNALIATFVFPLVRVLALLAAAPPYNNASLPVRVRLILGLAITLAIAPAVGAAGTPPGVAPASGAGLLILAEQMLIGYAMGFSMRLVFSAVDLAGNVFSTQMGLGFATFYDPLNSAQTPVIAEFINLLALLLFLSMNGHLLYLATLAQSFTAIPVSATPLGAGSWLNLVELGNKMFSAGLLLSLPIVAALMITNVALAVLTRAAPQLNLFALGFPLTLMGGFFALAVSLNYMATPIQGIFELGMEAMLGYVVPARP